MDTLLLVLLTAILLIRHAPQIVIDWRGRKNKPEAVCHIWARGWMIQLLYLVVLIGCILKLTAKFHSVTPLDWVGIAVVAVGAGLGLVGLLTLGSSYSFEIQINPDMRIVQSGIYSIVRHPQRLGLAIELLGLVLLAQVWWLIIPVLGVLFLQASRTAHEECFLRQHFGEEYINYCYDVPKINFVKGLSRGFGRKRRIIQQVGVQTRLVAQRVRTR